MKFELPVDNPALMNALYRAYGFPVVDLTFVPQGEVGCHYRADCVDGKSYFVTLLTGSRLAQIRIAHLDFTLELTRSLYDRGLFRSLPAPHRTQDGALKANFQGQPLIAYEYIDGHTLGDLQLYPAEVLKRLGQLTAQLHLSTSQLGMKIPFVEQFNLPFEAALLESLFELEKVTSHHRPGQQALSDLLFPQKDTLLRLLTCLHEIGLTARALHPPMVLCHTDMTPNNIIQTQQGDLFIVDWEGAMLAPAEHDLFIFAGEGFRALLSEYCQEFGSPALHPELFAYYFYRRNLEDITDFNIRILHENTTDEQDRYDLDLLQEDCLSGWPFLENSIVWARERLQGILPE